MAAMAVLDNEAPQQGCCDISAILCCQCIAPVPQLPSPCPPASCARPVPASALACACCRFPAEGAGTRDQISACSYVACTASGVLQGQQAVCHRVEAGGVHFCPQHAGSRSIFSSCMTVTQVGITLPTPQLCIEALRHVAHIPVDLHGQLCHSTDGSSG